MLGLVIQLLMWEVLLPHRSQEPKLVTAHGLTKQHPLHLIARVVTIPRPVAKAEMSDAVGSEAPIAVVAYPHWNGMIGVGRSDPGHVDTGHLVSGLVRL